jgi:uncharacterized protein (TIGR02145 family)
LYNTETQRCGAGNVIETKCGTNYYDPSTHFCLNSTIYAKCGNQDYSPSTQYCSNGIVKAYGSVSYVGKTYKTVVIGTQTWMAENLNVAYSSGNGNSACYNNQESYCNTYGRLYDWAAAMDLPSSCNSSSCASQVSTKGICPSGWHIPSDEEWDILVKYVDPNWTSNSGDGNIAGTKLKATSGWNSYSGTDGGTDEFGFAALPGGYGYSGGLFDNAGGIGRWWSSSELSADIAYYRGMIYNYKGVSGIHYNKTYLFSVRCLQGSGSSVCGANYYNPETQRCGAGNVIETKCGANYYDPSTYFCLSGTITAKCGDKEYTSAQTCQDGAG